MDYLEDYGQDIQKSNTLDLTIASLGSSTVSGTALPYLLQHSIYPIFERSCLRNYAIRSHNFGLYAQQDIFRTTHVQVLIHRYSMVQLSKHDDL